MKKNNIYIILSEKSWHLNLFEKLKLQFYDDEWILINSTDNFKVEYLNHYNPDRIFIPHWSYIIPKDIYEKFNCIVFHMTDLPYGRGGSPLQNLIRKGNKTTKISAIDVQEELDSGNVYLKKPLELNGTAKEIFLRANLVIEEMIGIIIKKNLVPKPQKGKITHFKRLKPKDGNIADLKDLNLVYDYIRMLDCEGYPNAFTETEKLKIEFFNANYDETTENIIANVRIFKK
jgi:methionyl-tRNA formyltransferase